MSQINKPTDYFNTVLYTGTGAIQSVTGVGFQPDWLWTKIRSDTGNHTVWDSVRGANASLQTSTTNAEGSSHIDSFDSDGFTLDAAIQNNSGQTYASWNWLAGGTASSNTDGTITSSVSASTTSGFSIVSWTANGSAHTVGHGLGVTPDVIIYKDRDQGTGYNWPVYHKSTGNTGGCLLNLTNAKVTTSGYFNDTSPTSSVFTIGTSVQGSGDSMIAYCFAEKKGFSKFGSYTGNGSTDGTFVYTGFKPSLVITKRTSTSGTGWVMMDNKRETTNDGATNYLLANDSVAETSASFAVDFLSNGFKPRTNSGGTNTSGETYIYMAFAENPLVGTNNIPATAR